MLSENADFEYAMVDGSIVRVHRHGKVQKGNAKAVDQHELWRSDDQDSGADRYTWILVSFRPIPGGEQENHGHCALLEGLEFGAFLGDKADWMREELHRCSNETVIPPKAKRLNPASYDAEKYK